MPNFVIQSNRGVEQLVARRAHNPEAGGSSPSPATKNRKRILRNRCPFFSVSYEVYGKRIRIYMLACCCHLISRIQLQSVRHFN